MRKPIEREIACSVVVMAGCPGHPTYAQRMLCTGKRSARCFPCRAVNVDSILRQADNQGHGPEWTANAGSTHRGSFDWEK